MANEVKDPVEKEKERQDMPSGKSPVLGTQQARHSKDKDKDKDDQEFTNYKDYRNVKGPTDFSKEEEAEFEKQQEEQDMAVDKAVQDLIDNVNQQIRKFGEDFKASNHSIIEAIKAGR